MQAYVKKSDDIVIIELKGNSDFESVTALDQTCQKYLNYPKIIFNLDGLHFVGSSGLSNFMDILNRLHIASSLKICHCRTEFQKLFAQSCLDIYEDEESAKKSFA